MRTYTPYSPTRNGTMVDYVALKPIQYNYLVLNSNKCNTRLKVVLRRVCESFMYYNFLERNL